MRFASVLAVLAASLPSLAFAQDARPPMTPPPAPAPAPAPAPVMVSAPVPQADPLPEGVDQAQLEDPNIDRSFLLPTAQTQPAGSISFNDYELIFLGLTYGVTNDLQVSITGLPPFVEEMPIWVTGAAKYRFLKQGNVRLAVQAGFTHLGEGDDSDGEDFEDDDESFTLGHVGLLASYCLTDDCHSMATASAQFMQPLSDREDTEGTAVLYSASVLAKVSPHVKLMLEVASAGAFTDDENENIDGVLVNYGVRFYSGGSIAGDIGFIRPFGDDDGDDEFVLGLPFVNFTYRAN